MTHNRHDPVQIARVIRLNAERKRYHECINSDILLLNSEQMVHGAIDAGLLYVEKGDYGRSWLVCDDCRARGDLGRWKTSHLFELRHP
jgi:hypothetical protein